MQYLIQNSILAAVILFVLNPVFVPAQQQVAASAQAGLDPAEKRVVLNWLADNAVPLKSLQAGTGHADLKPLKSVFKNVRIVGLGEASHGQREFFQFKHRMLEFLVTQVGFGAFSLEASYPACMNINEYVVHGTGDPRKALTSQGFDQFDTQEIFEMVQWMRQYNSKLPVAKRIKFLGYDMQSQHQYAVTAVTKYLKKVSPEKVGEAETAFLAFKAERGKPMTIATQTAEEQTKSIARLEDLHSFLAANRDKFVRQTSDWDFDVVLLHARVLVQGATYSTASMAGIRKFQADKDNKSKSMYSFLGDAIALRDRYMAENVESQLKMLGPKGRIAVGGHNGHIQLGLWGDGIPDFKGLKLPSMGGFLREKFGDAYYALGFDFDRGSFQALDAGGKGRMVLQEFQMPPAAEGSAAWYFKAATEGKAYKNCLINFRTAPTQGPVAEWLASPLGMTMLTGAYSKDRKRADSQAFLSLRENFDGMLFVEETSRARPVVASKTASVDIAGLWDFSNPELSERRFRSALETAVGDDALILQTQIARTHMLRKNFEAAREILKTLEPGIQTAGAEAQIRYWLELGRSYASHQHSAESQTPESKQHAREAFTRAHSIAKEARLDGLAIDAIHMFTFVDTAPVDQVVRGQEALALVEASDQPEAKRWEASVRSNLGEALYELGRYDEALVHFKTALALREKGANARVIRDAHWQVARVLRSRGQIEEALAIQLRLEQESQAAGDPRDYIFKELELLYRAKGNSERANHYGNLAKSHKK